MNIIKTVAILAAFAVAGWLSWVPGDPAIASGPVAAAAAAPAALTPKAVKYKNCTKLNKKYKHGVGKKGAKDKTSGKPVTNFKRSNSLYNANRHLDRDGDKIACEKH